MTYITNGAWKIKAYLVVKINGPLSHTLLIDIIKTFGRNYIHPHAIALISRLLSEYFWDRPE